MNHSHNHVEVFGFCGYEKPRV